MAPKPDLFSTTCLWAHKDSNSARLSGVRVAHPLLPLDEVLCAAQSLSNFDVTRLLIYRHAAKRIAFLQVFAGAFRTVHVKITRCEHRNCSCWLFLKVKLCLVVWRHMLRYIRHPEQKAVALDTEEGSCLLIHFDRVFFLGKFLPQLGLKLGLIAQLVL